MNESRNKYLRDSIRGYLCTWLDGCTASVSNLDGWEFVKNPNKIEIFVTNNAKKDAFGMGPRRMLASIDFAARAVELSYTDWGKYIYAPGCWISPFTMAADKNPIDLVDWVLGIILSVTRDGMENENFDRLAEFTYRGIQSS